MRVAIWVRIKIDHGVRKTIKQQVSLPFLMCLTQVYDRVSHALALPVLAVKMSDSTLLNVVKDQKRIEMTKKLTKKLSQIDRQITEHAKNLEDLLERLKLRAEELKDKGTLPVQLAETENMIEEVKMQLDRLRFGG